MTHDWPVLVKAAFLIDEVVAAYINVSYGFEDGKIPKDLEKIIEDGDFESFARNGKLPYDLANISDAQSVMDDAICYDDFEGQAQVSFPQMLAREDNRDWSYDCDLIVYIAPEKEADLFSAAYANKEELLNEYKKAFSVKGVMFPDDFNWWGHIVDIDGTYSS